VSVRPARCPSSDSSRETLRDAKEAIAIYRYSELVLDSQKTIHALIGEKRIEVRVACTHVSPQTDDSTLLEWCAVACLIEHGRRPFEVMATGVSKGVEDEDVAIRLALLNLSEKVGWQDQEIIAQALAQPVTAMVDRPFSPKEIFARKPRSISELIALLRRNFSA
jgi:hypothetical protein